MFLQTEINFAQYTCIFKFFNIDKIFVNSSGANGVPHRESKNNCSDMAIDSQANDWL